MIAIAHEKSSRLRILISIGFWASSVGGLLLPWSIMLAVDIFFRHLPIARAWRSFSLHLFAPGYNFFLIGALTAVPFVILAVVILLHLGTALLQNQLIARRRAFGLGCAGLGMLITAGWTHVDVLLHPDAQGALAYFFLPILLLLILPVGYGLGRVLARVLMPRPSA